VRPEGQRTGMFFVKCSFTCIDSLSPIHGLREISTSMCKTALFRLFSPCCHLQYWFLNLFNYVEIRILSRLAFLYSLPWIRPLTLQYKPVPITYGEIYKPRENGTTPGHITQQLAVGYAISPGPPTSATYIHKYYEVTWYENSPSFAPD